MVASPGTSLHRLITGSEATAALSAPVSQSSRPTVGVLAVDGYPGVRLMFGGTDAANETINFQVIQWREVRHSSSVAYVPKIVAAGAATLGAAVYDAAADSAAGTKSNFWADTLAMTTALAGVRVDSPADNTRAALVVPTDGAGLLSVETDVDSAYAADVFAQLLNERAMLPATEAALADALGSDVTAGVASTVNVTTASTAVLAASTTRRQAVITNMSDVLVWVNIGAAAEADKGFPLAPAVGDTPGGSLPVGGGAAKLAINAIHEGAGNKAVAVWAGSAS